MSCDEHSDSDSELKELLEEACKKEQSIKENRDNVKRSLSSESEAEVAPKKTKRGKNDQAKIEYEKHLDKLIFGDKAGLLENLKKASNDNEDINPDNPERKPAWHDSDDENFQVGDVIRENKSTGSLSHLNKEKKYSELLKRKFERIQSTPKWAELDRERDEDSDEELLKSVGHLAKPGAGMLPANNIEHKRLKDLNRATYAERSIRSVQFHPTSTVALVAGESGVASIYSIDGKKNEKLHSVQFKKFPVKCARILPNGQEVLIGGSNNYFYSYDLMLGEAVRVFLPKVMTKLNKFELSPSGKYLAAVGRFGEVHLLDTGSKELIHTFKQEYVATALHFSGDSSKLFVHSSGSDVSVLDLRKERIEHIFTDDGCIRGKCLAISANDQMLATGSNEGVVNIYKYDDVMTSKSPIPEKIVDNLTTSISDIKFNHSSEILAICSEKIPDAVKMVHFPTGTVFANFPGFQANVGRIRTVSFSPSSGYLALGNIAKEVPLFRLKHFCNY